MAIPSQIVDLIQPHTKSTPQRMESMYDALVTVDKEDILGDVVECGVWRGGNIMMARMVSPMRMCWLYDTFDGMTMPNADLDVKRSGERAIDRYHLKMNGGTKWDAISLEEVQKSFAKMGIVRGCNFVVGPIEETLLECQPEDQISVLRLDVDWHAPTKIALERLYPKVATGGFLIVDDYGHWMGCRKAVDDYFGEERPPMTEVDYSCVVFRKC